MGLQQASRQSGFHGVGSVATRGLLDLAVDGQTVPYQGRAEGRALIGGFTQAVEIDGRGRSRHQARRRG